MEIHPENIVHTEPHLSSTPFVYSSRKLPLLSKGAHELGHTWLPSMCVSPLMGLAAFTAECETSHVGTRTWNEYSWGPFSPQQGRLSTGWRGPVFSGPRACGSCSQPCKCMACGQVDKLLGSSGPCPSHSHPKQGAGGRGAGRRPVQFCKALPELHIRLPQNESRSLLSGLSSLPLIWHGLSRMDQQQPFLVGRQQPLPWAPALPRSSGALPGNTPGRRGWSCPHFANEDTEAPSGWVSGLGPHSAAGSGVSCLSAYSPLLGLLLGSSWGGEATVPFLCSGPAEAWSLRELVYKLGLGRRGCEMKQ